MVAPRSGGRALDLGCGTGHLTLRLHEHLGARETLGLDPSPAMLERARDALASKPSVRGVTFREGVADDVREGASWDVIVSNAALHWVPEHEALLARLTGALAPEGQIAIQMPFNEGQPFVTALDATLAEEPFASACRTFRRARNVLAPTRYARLLRQLGLVRTRVRTEVYVHALPARDDVVTWVRGGLLTQLEAPLGPELYAEFLVRYAARLLPELPDERPFLFPFQRVFLYGARAEGSTVR